MEIPSDLIVAKKAVEFDIMALPGVVGIGIGMREEAGELYDELAVCVMVSDLSKVPNEIPSQIAGVAVCLVEGELKPCLAPDDARYPTLKGGIKITSPHGAGTLGAIVKDASTNELLGLTNYHVTGDAAGFPFGSIWQPTSPQLIFPPPLSMPKIDYVGQIVRGDYPRQPVPTTSNAVAGIVDAATFKLDALTGLVGVPQLTPRPVSPAIVGDLSLGPDLIPKVTATVEPSVTQRVRKRGFVTGVTYATVQLEYWTCKWPPGGANAFMLDQALLFADVVDVTRNTDPVRNPHGAFLLDGDSGALVLDASAPTALGLVWANNTEGGFLPGGRYGVMCRIKHVESRLGVKTVW